MINNLNKLLFGKRMSKLAVGGQAVIEGVMMKSPKYYSKADAWRYMSLSERYRIFRLPFLRGIVSFWEMLRLGMKSLSYSAKESGEEEEELSDFAITMTIIFSVLLAVALFVVVPYIIPHFLGLSEENNTVLFNLVDGIIKILIFVGYVFAISFMEDIRRVFQYHGAEHMAVNCYEKGKRLTVSNALKFGTYHPRCGTSFVVFVLVTMVLVFSFIPLIVKGIFPGIDSWGVVTKKLAFFGLRLVFILPVAGISYEFLKLSGRMRDNFIAKIIAFPGKLVQGITTRKPDKKQIEVAIAALKEVLAKESKHKES